MTVALILLAALIIVGGVLRIEHGLYQKRHARTPENAPEPEKDSPKDGEECCGMHITCERDSLLAGVSKEIEYYDDEELDRHIGCDPENYSEEEIEEFRDILLTLRPEEIAGWARSLQLRGVPLPPCVREELLMIVAEARAASATVTA